MNINPKELQKFHDLWAPMIAALPAVINAAESANELVNHERVLRAELNSVVSATAASKAEADANAVAAQALLANLNAQRLSLDAEVKEHAKATRKAIADAKADADAKIKAYQARAAEVEAETAAAEEALRLKLKDADNAMLIQKSEHDAAISALEAKRVAAELALDKLRQKLG